MSDSPTPLAAVEPAHRTVVQLVRPRRRRWTLHLLPLLATVFTTLVVGARFAENFQHGQPLVRTEDDLFPLMWALGHPARLWLGLPYALTILGILSAHEMGHFVACLRYRVAATLPWFLPAPTLSGTAGAVIRIRSRIPNRTALMDIGVAGPIAGFVVALPCSVAGLLLSRPLPPGADRPFIDFHPPLIFAVLHGILALVDPGIAPLGSMLMHPALLACWVGMFATALNLLPGGQLDGGHILYATYPGLHRWASRALIVALAVCGVLFWVGWLLWALILLLPVMRHPSVPTWPPLPHGRRALFWIAQAMFVLTMLPQPFAGAGLVDFLR